MTRPYGELGNALSELLRASGRTATAVMGDVGLHKTNWSQWSAGAKRPDEHSLRRIAEILGGDYLELRRLAGYWVPDGDEAHIEGWRLLPPEDRTIIIRLSQRLAAASLDAEEAAAVLTLRAAPPRTRAAILEAMRISAAQAPAQDATNRGGTNRR
jgi:transcriptional regulator with XRE-family HTH domain